MRLASLRAAQLRTHPQVEIALDADLTIVDGPNGAGKTNLLEAIVLAATGRSWRTRTDRELVRHGEDAGRAELRFTDEVGASHALSLTVHRGTAERMHVLDGSRVEITSPRPQVVVFAPDRLALVQGSPQGRRGHVDQLVAALWPSRSGARAEYSRALGQRNALLHRPGAPAMEAWEAELARHGVALREARAAAIAEVAEGFAEVAADLGLPGKPSLVYRPADDTATVEELAALLAERRDRDRERGFTQVGPHRDELAIRRDDRDLRSYGSQGEQRLAVLALLLAERAKLHEVRSRPPVALLDDVGSELDPGRRRRLVEEVCRYGQVVIATTSAEELGAVDLPASQRLVHVSPVDNAKFPTSSVTVE
ncbi:MAG: DNA replication and repair protein RecF [Solirubrobacteraceae bacterium]|nr:DNA replication and repair protein RecF [Solirubrobacteraceae bacterium]